MPSSASMIPRNSNDWRLMDPSSSARLTHTSSIPIPLWSGRRAEGTAYRRILRDGPTARFLGGGLSVFEAKRGVCLVSLQFRLPPAPSCPQMASYDNVCFGELGFLRVVEFVIWPYREVLSPRSARGAPNCVEDRHSTRFCVRTLSERGRETTKTPLLVAEPSREGTRDETCGYALSPSTWPTV